MDYFGLWIMVVSALYMFKVEIGEELGEIFVDLIIPPTLFVLGYYLLGLT